ncbi:MAG: hypothetical protein ACRC91_07895 [Aeromonas sp.]
MSDRNGNKGSGGANGTKVQPSLDALLHANSPEKGAQQKKPTRGKPTVAARSLQDILAEASSTASPASVDRAGGSSGSLQKSQHEQMPIVEVRAPQQLRSSGQQLPSLDSLLQSGESPVGFGRPRADARTHKTMPENLESLISKADRPDDRTRPDAAPRRRRYIALAAVGFIAALATMSFFSQRQAMPDSEVARQLLVIAEDIEHYQAEHRQLPEKLSDLPRFPDSAVEWPIENYEVRLATPQLEFFFFNDPGSYVLIARFDDEVWVYDRGRSPPLRREQSEQY